MALVKCRECGKEVSTEAGACPQCGAPRPTTSSSSGSLPESPFKTGPQKPLAPKPAPPVEARLKELREKRRREAQRRTVARIMWGGVALALVGIGYWALREVGTGNPGPVLILLYVGFAALVGFEAAKRSRSWVLYGFVSLIGTPILALILLAIDAGNRPKKS